MYKKNNFFIDKIFLRGIIKNIKGGFTGMKIKEVKKVVDKKSMRGAGGH